MPFCSRRCFLARKLGPHLSFDRRAHHFRGDDLANFFRRHELAETQAFLYYDFQPSFLATVDGGALCGFRAFAGRSALIRKGPYYIRAILRGAISAQVASFLSLAVLLVAIALSHHRSELRGDLEDAAGRMLWIFVPYAAAVLFNLALRALPSTDIRAATSVMVLGPLTGLRPFVMIAGVLYGVWSSQLLETKLLGVFVLATMLLLESFLSRIASRRQQRELAAAS